MNKEQLQLLGLPEGRDRRTDHRRAEPDENKGRQRRQSATRSSDADRGPSNRRPQDPCRPARPLYQVRQERRGGNAGRHIQGNAAADEANRHNPAQQRDSPDPGAGQAPAKTYKKLGDVPESERLQLRNEQPQEYMRLYKEEYGHDCPPLN